MLQLLSPLAGQGTILVALLLLCVEGAVAQPVLDNRSPQAPSLASSKPAASRVMLLLPLGPGKKF